MVSITLSEHVGLVTDRVIFDTPHRAQVVFVVRSDSAPVLEICEEVFDEGQELDYHSAIRKAAGQLYRKIGWLDGQLNRIADGLVT